MHIDLVSRLVRSDPEFVGFQHFEIDLSIAAFADQLAEENYPEDPHKSIPRDELICPVSARLPAPKMTLLLPAAIFVLVQDSHGDAVVGRFPLSPYFEETGLELVGAIRPSHAPIIKESHDKRLGPERCFDTLFWLAHVLALINEPSIVCRRPSETRQRRRAAHRGMGFAVDAWTRVTWDLSAETAAKVARDPTFHKVPLHWRRGHFRRALPHFKGATQRPDAVRVEDRKLWWQWIEGQWVGHPIFGLRKSVHAPKISSGAVARRRQYAEAPQP